MTKDEFDSLIDPTQYQVFIFDSYVSLLLLRLHHPWFVINKKGNIFRYEIRKTKNKNTKLGHLHINYEVPYKSLYFSQKIKILKTISGDENSLAKHMIDFIEKSPISYPLLNKYSLLNANCGTYIAWILSNFPEIKIEYPWKIS